MLLTQLIAKLGCHSTQYGTNGAIVAYPNWCDRFEFYHLADYKVSSSISAGGLVLVPRFQPDMYSALVK